MEKGLIIQTSGGFIAELLVGAILVSVMTDVGFFRAVGVVMALRVSAAALYLVFKRLV